MLQFITSPSSATPQVEQAAKAIEGGSSWIEISAGDGMEAVAAQLVERFKGEDIFLVLPDDVALVDKLRIHGVVLSSADPKHVAETRENLGPHAVIGVRVKSAGEAAALRAIDVDYIIYCVPSESEEAVLAWTEFKKELEAAQVPFHTVASGEFTPATAAALRAAGAAGVAVSTAIADASDPVKATALFIDALNS